MNRWTGIGRVTKQPKLTEHSGRPTSIMRVAVKMAGADGRDGHFEVRCVAEQAIRCSELIKVGRQVAVDGRLTFEEFRTGDGSYTSQVYIIADRLEPL